MSFNLDRKCPFSPVAGPPGSPVAGPPGSPVAGPPGSPVAGPPGSPVQAYTTQTRTHSGTILYNCCIAGLF